MQLQLFGLIGTVSRPNMQKIWIIGALFENRLHCQFKVETNFYKLLFLGYKSGAGGGGRRVL
jgi:hypothetical protein